MLDTYIIDRIRREREPRESVRVPLRIGEPSPHYPPREPEDRHKRSERGVAIIDFTI